MGHHLITPKHCKDERGYVSVCLYHKKYKYINGEYWYEKIFED